MYLVREEGKSWRGANDTLRSRRAVRLRSLEPCLLRRRGPLQSFTTCSQLVLSELSGAQSVTACRDENIIGRNKTAPEARGVAKQ